MIGSLTYLILFIVYVSFFGYGTYYIIKNKFSITETQRRIYFFFIFLCYFLNVLEKLVTPHPNEKFVNDIIPFGNLSPFIFTISSISILFKSKHLKYFYSVLAIMSFAMMGAGLYNASTLMFFSKEYSYTCVFYDTIAHGLIALFGFYLLRNGIVKFDKKEIIISISFIMSITFLILILNVIFDTSFFGLSLNGKHHIYEIVISSNSYVSCALYILGLFTILISSAYVNTKIKNKFIDGDGGAIL